jgi:Raf kinase inhibitor-like YbhB/YbcL family protein
MLVATVSISLAVTLISSRRHEVDKNTPEGGMQLISSAFKNGASIPEQFTCKGQNINPPLSIVSVPEQAKSLALIMHDPDALGSDFVHWLIWDIPANTKAIGTNSVPVGAVQGVNGFGSNNYGGPCPPSGSGTHRYIFELYALDTSLSLSADSTRDKLQYALESHVLAQSNLTGLVAAQN